MQAASRNGAQISRKGDLFAFPARQDLARGETELRILDQKFLIKSAEGCRCLKKVRGDLQEATFEPNDNDEAVFERLTKCDNTEDNEAGCMRITKNHEELVHFILYLYIPFKVTYAGLQLLTNVGLI